MSVDFTPIMRDYKNTGTFKFWCQKVLPLVYDDSLSYYELLCKVVNYLNDVIQNADALDDNVRGLYNAYVQLQDYVNNYFDNLNVQNEINEKLDTMASDGSLSALIQPLFDSYKSVIDNTISTQNEEISVLKSRMDSFTSLPSGSTTGDAELQDIRVGANGTVYPNAGDAVRGQVSNLNIELNNLENAVLERKRLDNSYTTGRYLDNGFNSIDTYIRNTDAYPAGKYHIDEYSISHMIVGYVSDTEGIDIVNGWVTGSQDFETSYDFYISFAFDKSATKSDISTIENNFNVIRINNESLESKLSTVLSNTDDVNNLLSEAYIINGNNDNNVRIASFTNGIGRIAIGDANDWCCYREFNESVKLGEVYEIPEYNNSGVTTYIVFKTLNGVFSSTGTDYKFTDTVNHLWKMPTIEEYFSKMVIKANNVIGASNQKIVFIGDSIFGLERGSSSIPSLVGNYTGAETYNCALGGTEGNSHGDTIWSNYDFTGLSQAIASGDYTNQIAHLSDSGVPSYFASVITQLESLDFSKVNLICLTYGGNDYINSHSNINTFINAMAANINRILTAYPNIRFLLMNPPYKRFLKPTTHEFIEDGDTKQNEFGKTLKDYAESYDTISKSAHVPYIDAYNDLGINKYNATQWFITNDGSHPNETGRKETAKLISEYLKRMIYN